VDADRASNAERLSAKNAGDVGPVPSRRWRVAVVGGSDGRAIASTGGEIADPLDAVAKLAMCAPDPGVDHIRVNTSPISGHLKPPVERQRALVDAIQSPRRPAGLAGLAGRREDTDGTEDTKGTKDTKGTRDTKAERAEKGRAAGVSQRRATTV
jgi:hypothetical protein